MMAFSVPYFVDDCYDVVVDGCVTSYDDVTASLYGSVAVDDNDKPWTLLTPPRSPCSATDSYASGDDEHGTVSAAGVCRLVSSSASSSSSSSSDLDRLLPCDCCKSGHSDFPVLNDCMWSAGLLPPDLQSGGVGHRVDVSGAERRSVASTRVVTGAPETVCVNPSMISSFPRMTAFSSPISNIQKSNLSSLQPVSCSTTDYSPCSSEPDDDDESGEEVDVVNVLPVRQPASIVRELLVLPSSASVLAQVNAMHNYSSNSGSSSSCNGPYQLSSRVVSSAPQSPSSSDGRHHYAKFSVERGLKRSVSTPASPSFCRLSSSRHRHLQHRRPALGNGRQHGGSDTDDSVQEPQPAQHGGKRALHNVLERRRRDHLKNSFEALRSVVPAANADVRMPKVVILRRARDHLRHLCITAQRLQAEHDRLRSLQQRWQYKLALLSRSNA